MILTLFAEENKPLAHLSLAAGRSNVYFYFCVSICMRLEDDLNQSDLQCTIRSEFVAVLYKNQCCYQLSFFVIVCVVKRATVCK